MYDIVNKLLSLQLSLHPCINDYVWLARDSGLSFKCLFEPTHIFITFLHRKYQY